MLNYAIFDFCSNYGIILAIFDLKNGKNMGILAIFDLKIDQNTDILAIFNFAL